MKQSKSIKPSNQNPEIHLVTTYEPVYPAGLGIQTQLVNLRYIPAHIHNDALEFIYCLEGEIYANVCHEFCYLAAGELVTVDQEDVRNIIAYEDNLTLIVHVNLDKIPFERQEIQNTLFSCATALADDKLKPHINKMYNKLIASAMTDDPEELEQLRTSIIRLMVDRFSWFSVLDMSDKNDKKYRERLLQIIDCVKENCKSKTTISQMASVMYLSPNYLSNFIRRTSFNSYTELIAFFKCLNAQKLLLQTDLPVSEIAVLSNFSSEKYLYKYFKHWWLYSPFQYRKKFQEYARHSEEYIEFDSDEKAELLQKHINAHFITDASNVD